MSVAEWNDSPTVGVEWRRFDSADPSTFPADRSQVCARMQDGRSGPATFYRDSDKHWALFNFPWAEASQIVDWAPWDWSNPVTFVKLEQGDGSISDSERSSLSSADQVYGWELAEKSGQRYTGLLFTNEDTGLHSIRILGSPLRTSLGESKRVTERVGEDFLHLRFGNYVEDRFTTDTKRRPERFRIRGVARLTVQPPHGQRAWLLSVAGLTADVRVREKEVQTVEEVLSEVQERFALFPAQSDVLRSAIRKAETFGPEFVNEKAQASL